MGWVINCKNYDNKIMNEIVTQLDLQPVLTLNHFLEYFAGQQPLVQLVEGRSLVQGAVENHLVHWKSPHVLGALIGCPGFQ